MEEQVEREPDTLTENAVPDFDAHVPELKADKRVRSVVREGTLPDVEWEDDAAPAPSEPTNWVERCERLQAELGAAKQREQNHLRLIERLVELGDLSSVDWSAEQEEELAPILIAARIHLKENGRG